MYRPQREENREKKADGQNPKYLNPAIWEAWHMSQSGADFKQQLENRGYQLVQGRKCIVIVDPPKKQQAQPDHLGSKPKN